MARDGRRAALWALVVVAVLVGGAVVAAWLLGAAQDRVNARRAEETVRHAGVPASWVVGPPQWREGR